jgi:general secretion pathway protein D
MRVPVRSFCRRLWPWVIVCLALASGYAADGPEEVKPPVLCSIAANNCDAPAPDQKRASDAYWKGVKLREKDLAVAYAEFTRAAELVPGNVDYANARELARTALEQQNIDRGNKLLDAGHQVEAAAAFRAALDLDSSNAFAQQRLMDALGEAAPQPSKRLRLVERSDPVDLQPRPGRQDIHYRGDSRGLYEMIARSFGVKATFDPSFESRAVRFDVQGVDFWKTMELADLVSKAFAVPLSENEMLLAADTAENHRLFDRMSMRTYYVSQAASPQELNDIVSTLRSVFDIRLVNPVPAKNQITIRAPRPALEAATQFLEQLSAAEPQQVLLDIQAIEIDHSLMRDLGVQLPSQYQLINLSQAAALLSSQPNVQQLINQLISGGGINQANSTALQTLLSQLQQQQLNPLLSTGFATFGKGITLFALTLPPETGHFQLNESTVKDLEHMTLRAMQGKAATLKIGSRYPILNATFAPIFNTQAIAQSIQNSTFKPAFPSFNYEDIGLSMKATPSIHGGSDVTLELETELKALTGQEFNGVPVISDRTYKSSITVKNGETAVLAGYINRTEQLSLAGYPGLGELPGIGLLAAEQNKSAEDDEFLLVIRPQILNAPPAETQAVWLPIGR